jgi:hypothetical protein
MKFAHLIPVPNVDAFDLHLHKLKAQTQSYLETNGHSVNHFVLDPEYDQHGWCEELIYFFTTTGRLDCFDYLIFSHSDILIEEFIFLDYIDQYVFGRPFYFVISVPFLKELCKIQVKYHFSNLTSNKLQSIFHGEKVKNGSVTISFDDFKFIRHATVDHADHIFYLNAKNMLYPRLNNPYRYDKHIDKLYHFTGVGVGSELMYSRTPISSDRLRKDHIIWKTRGLIRYACHKFRSSTFTDAELEYIDEVIISGLNDNHICKHQLKINLEDILETNRDSFKVGIEINYQIIERLLNLL